MQNKTVSDILQHTHNTCILTYAHKPIHPSLTAGQNQRMFLRIHEALCNSFIAFAATRFCFVLFVSYVYSRQTFSPSLAPMIPRQF